MAVSRVLVQLLVSGSTALARSLAAAYTQALRNASKGGASNVMRSGGMNVNEARSILGIKKNTSLNEMLEKYHSLYENLKPVKNKYGGSFYLQGKLFGARDVLEKTYRKTGTFEEIVKKTKVNNKKFKN